MKLTEEQEKAIRLASDDNGNLKIIAYAGTGKTSVLRFIAEAFQEQNKNCIYLAFNKDIVEEAKKKMPANTSIMTFHSLAFKKISPNITRKVNQGSKLVFKNFCETFNLDKDIKFNISGTSRIGGSNEVLLPYMGLNHKLITIDSKKIFQIIRKTLEVYLKDDSSEIRNEHIEIAIGAICKTTEISKESIYEFDDTNQYSLSGLVREFAEKLWFDYCNSQGVFRISHDVYLKLYALTQPIINYDVILLDESQDTDKLMLSILKRQSAKIIFVGDPYQQIYDWRGAVNAIEKFNGREVYLTQSFRFGNKIAEIATVLLDALDAPKPLIGLSSVESEVDKEKQLPIEVNVILCRTNAGLMDIALRYLTQYPDKKLYAQLSGNINTSTIRQWFLKLKEFEHDPETGKKDEILSNFESFSALKEYCQDFPEDEEISQYFRLYQQFDGNIVPITELLNQINLHQNSYDILLTTVHKAKGREWDNVLLNDDFHSLKYESELRLMYVAVTRARKKIYIGRGNNRPNIN